MKTNTPRLLGVIIVLQALILLSQWIGVPRATPARAEISNPGQRQIDILTQLQDTNAKLDKMLELFKSGKLQVQVAKPDDTK